MTFTKRFLTGKEYLSTVTDLLQRARLEGPFEGLYEAADLQWWWRRDDAAIPDRQQFWFNSEGVAVACLVRFDAGSEWSNDFMWLPSARGGIEKEIIPEVIAAICAPDKLSLISAREDDLFLRDALERVGFAQGSEVMVESELVNDPARTQLPPGFILTSRVEDKMPHHLIRRNGSEVTRKLGECSLYRPELDLCVRDADGNVAAYALFWMDEVTKVGLLEPLRTEREYQRLGLAKHLIAEGVAGLRALGAERIRVFYSLGNEAAVRAYRQAGFEDKLKILEYHRPPG